MKKLALTVTSGLAIVGVLALVLMGAGLTVSVGLTVELPPLPALPTPALQTPALPSLPALTPTPWTGDAVPAPHIACFPAPCDCFPDC